MDEHECENDDSLFDGWSHLTPVERECITQIDSEENHIERLQIQREAALERLWLTFQSAAASLAHLYKEPPCDCMRSTHNNNNNNRTWTPFQNAANRVTHLYKDGNDGCRAGFEHGYLAGYQKRNKDLMTWARKKRKTIRREDLLLHLSGRSPPRRNRVSETRTSAVSLSPKPAPTDELMNFNLNLGDSELDFATALSEGRNPFADARKRQNNDFFPDTPHKRARFS